MVHIQYSMSGFLYSLHIHYTTQYSFNSWDIVVTFIVLQKICENLFDLQEFFGLITSHKILYYFIAQTLL